MSRTPLTTYSDILEFLLRLKQGTVDTRIKLLAKSAIESAYQELPLMRRWKYYYRRGRIVTDAAYSTGTVAYDHTGGANERQLTLTSGTWPTNAARGKVLIDNYEYEVASRVSSTVVTLSVNSNPGEDVASTSYEWWRDTYPMPIDFVGADALIDHSGYWRPSYGTPGNVLGWRVNNQVSNEPWSYSFIPDPDYVGTMAVFFHPPPDQVYRFDFMYHRSPLPLRVLDYSTGTVSVSSTTVTGTGTSFTDRMLGTVIRFPESGVDQIPTGLDGLYPFAEERIVTAVNSATSLTIDATLDGTYSGVKHRISDFIDVDNLLMREAFKKFCEYRFAENLSAEDQGSRFRSFQNALALAKEADGKRDFSNVCPGPVYWYDRMDQGRTGDDL